MIRLYETEFSKNQMLKYETMKKSITQKDLKRNLITNEGENNKKIIN
jgi:hypothetical protein